MQQRFDALQDSSWTKLDASKSIEDLQAEVSLAVGKLAGRMTAINSCHSCVCLGHVDFDLSYHKLGKAYANPYPSLST